MNSVNLIGNLTRDPELKATQSDTSVCSMRVAINGRNDQADYVDVTAFGKLAETAAQYLAKGRQVAISGRLSSSEWQTDDGQKRSRVEVIAQDVRFLGAKPQDGDQDGAAPDKDPLDEL